MKSVLISIKPKWCELIASGKKTIEVRKTRPKIETPFKCYIYETKAKTDVLCTARGRVIGEFVCDAIYDIEPHYDTPNFCNQYVCGWNAGDADDCLSFSDLNTYLGGKHGYGWHISDLKIYDKPRELSEFCAWKKCNSCKTSGYESTACMYDEDCKVPAVVTRPPQSWCYVEELKDV